MDILVDKKGQAELLLTHVLYNEVLDTMGNYFDKLGSAYQSAPFPDYQEFMYKYSVTRNVANLNARFWAAQIIFSPSVHGPSKMVFVAVQHPYILHSILWISEAVGCCR